MRQEIKVSLSKISNSIFNLIPIRFQSHFIKSSNYHISLISCEQKEKLRKNINFFFSSKFLLIIPTAGKSGKFKLLLSITMETVDQQLGSLDQC